MKHRVSLLLAAMLFAVTVTQPARAGNRATLSATPNATVTAVRSPVPATLETTRTFVRDELQRLGRDIAAAAQVAAELTPDDLAVLFANPKMMQPAGEYSAQSANLMAALLLLGGIIALAAASDGSVLLFD
ncbi:MAG: hypothetical protein HKO59_14080 [Phycisphaerales bacterium]|nr:hypothetical protein [Phycisphaerae bacterium]NNF42856.1 hypothetical protein [Phycisphaerales bacterium]NNM27089.1 hypothetical protein [Phycisphaerales bacterium]